MKNPHGVPPTRYMQKTGSAIYCKPTCGPIFGFHTLYIEDTCVGRNRGHYSNTYEHYECHPEYKSSLFVDTNGPDNINYFSVLDYEVYCIGNYADYIYNKCKYPALLYEYMITNDISEDLLKQVDDEKELINDLNAIHCKSNNILLKISKCCFKNPSEILSDTQIISKDYDKYLKEWIGDHDWKFVYRFSEQKDHYPLFRQYCSDEIPTLIIIKSTRGYIFGSYTTQPWKRYNIFSCIYSIIFMINR